MKKQPIIIDNKEHYQIRDNFEIQKFVSSILSKITNVAPIKEDDNKFFSEILSKEKLPKKTINEIYADIFLLEVLFNDPDHAYEYLALSAFLSDTRQKLLECLNYHLDKLGMHFSKYSNNLKVIKTLSWRKKYYFFDFGFALKKFHNKSDMFSYGKSTNNIEFNRAIEEILKNYNKKILNDIHEKVKVLNNITEEEFQNLINDSKLNTTNFFKESNDMSIKSFFNEFKDRIDVIKSLIHDKINEKFMPSRSK